jgi:hypothetical protein
MSPVLGRLDVRFFDFRFRHDDSKGCFFECVMNVIDYLLLFYKYYAFLGGEGISRRCNSAENCGYHTDLTVFSFFPAPSHCILASDTKHQHERDTTWNSFETEKGLSKKVCMCANSCQQTITSSHREWVQY